MTEDKQTPEGAANDNGLMVPIPQELKTIYIAGPMRGKEYFNFPAFDEARDRMKERGWNVISPADLDREAGFDPYVYFGTNFDPDDDDCPDSEEFWDELPSKDDGWDGDACMMRDIAAIQDKADAILLLPGWESSTGAIAEYMLSVWKGIPAFAYPGMEPVSLDQTFFVYQKGAEKKKAAENAKDPLEEAIEITGGDRNKDYGKPEDNHKRTAAFWTHYLGYKVNARQVCMMNVLQKISRDVAHPKRDNIVDIPGYCRNIWMIEEGLG